MSGRTALVLGVLIIVPASASARTWHVEKDGSGDFTVIQAAVDAASAGDTIRIGPGEFREKHPFSTPGWTEDVNVSVTTDGLTIIGSGAGMTIVGPAVRDVTPGIYPKVIVEGFISDLKVSGVSIENAYHGMYAIQGHLEMSDCGLSNCTNGLVVWTEGGTTVDACQFSDNGVGIDSFGPASSILVQSCGFVNNGYSMSFNNGSTGVRVSDCQIHGGAVGVQVAVSSDAEITNCLCDGATAVGFFLSLGSSVVLTSNIVRNGRYSLDMDSAGIVSGSGNVFGCGDSIHGTVMITGGSIATLRGNHILNAAPYSVVVASYPNSPPLQLDLTNNYWGTTDSATIAGWIYDGHDDASIHAFVNYEPFSDHPLGTEAKTWGELKALYGK